MAYPLGIWYTNASYQQSETLVDQDTATLYVDSGTGYKNHSLLSRCSQYSPHSLPGHPPDHAVPAKISREGESIRLHPWTARLPDPSAPRQPTSIRSHFRSTPAYQQCLWRDIEFPSDGGEQLVAAFLAGQLHIVFDGSVLRRNICHSWMLVQQHSPTVSVVLAPPLTATRGS